jgi:hypothetical protein
MSIGIALEDEWKRFEATNGDIGRKVVAYLRVRFTSPVSDVVATLVAQAKTAEVRDVASVVAADATAKELELVQMALKVTSEYRRQLPVTIAALKRSKEMLEADH